MPEITRELVKQMAAAHGLPLGDDRVERVRQEYESFLRLCDQIVALNLPPETEPAPDDGVER